MFRSVRLPNCNQHFAVKPDVDLFASGLNFQVTKNISYRPDPGTMVVSASHTPWKNYIIYSFLTLCILYKILYKMNTDMATGNLIGQTQFWCQYLMSVLIDLPL